MMKLIRAVLSPVILFFDRLFAPKSLVRPPSEQARVDQETASLALYQLVACPFCVKVRRAMKRLNLHIELRDIAKNESFERELIEKGGQKQVPCLLIKEAGKAERWMYESSDIISYLDTRFHRLS